MNNYIKFLDGKIDIEKLEKQLGFSYDSYFCLCKIEQRKWQNAATAVTAFQQMKSKWVTYNINKQFWAEETNTSQNFDSLR